MFGYAKMKEWLSEQLQSQKEESADRISALETAITKHDNVLEDLIEEFESVNEEEKELVEKLTIQAENSRVRELLKEENDLFSLIAEYHKEITALEALVSKNSAWKEQVSIMKRKLANMENALGLYEVSDENHPFNYDMHEVTDIIETNNPSLDRKILSVQEKGLLFKGRIIKKAKVTAYRYRER